MDRNQIIGFVLMGLLLIAYMFFFSPEPGNPEQQAGKAKTDSAKTQPAQPSLTQGTEPVPTDMPDSLLQQKMGPFVAGAKGQAADVVLENKDIQVTLSSLGGKIKKVWLKNYKTYSQQPLVLISDSHSHIAANIQTSSGPVDLYKLYYQVEKPSANAVSFRIPTGNAQYIEQQYSLPESGFVLNYRLNLEAAGAAIKDRNIVFTWQDDMPLLEKDLEISRTQSTVNFYTQNGAFEALTESSHDLEEARPEDAVKWVSFKQKFFSASLITDQAFNKLYVKSSVDPGNPNVVKTVAASLVIPVADLKSDKSNLRYYFGPNDYHITKTVAPGFEKNVYLGWSLFAVVNVYLIAPLFEFLEQYISSYGVLIFLLVVIIKLLLLPLAYRSYISMAKMRVLKPDIDALKERFGDDMQKLQQEQMKLYSQVGANPIAGCIPALLQFPVLLAMFNYFPNAIHLRQESLWWAEDLSTYDSFIMLPFTIPMYGDHISLFTLLMTLSTLVYTYYTNQVSTSVEGPMKTVSYVMPVFFMFILNRFSAGLTFYYLVSNIISIVQQIVIRRFVNEDKLKALLDQNRQKSLSGTKKKSTFQQKLEAALNEIGAK